MKTKLIFLRHAETEKNPLVNAANWGLSDKGKSQAGEISNLSEMQSVDCIYASEEIKTTLTVEPLVKKINKEIIALGNFNEVKRGDKFLTKQEFEEEKVKQLKDLKYRAFDGESGIDALDRFKEGITKISNENLGKVILIVTHGTILNIYFANLLNKYDDLPERWNKTSFCAFGIIEDGKVIKDII